MTRTGKVYWNRVGYVAIQGPDGKMYNYGGESGDALDFKFDGKKVNDVNFKFTVGILGLGMETINELTTWDKAKSSTQKRKIEVYAGYENDGLKNPLFSGYILTATPTNPPEMWMNFECMPFIGKEQSASEEPMIKKPLKKILEKIGQLLGLDSKWNCKSPRGTYLGSFQFTGKVTSLPSKFANKFGVKVFVQDGVLVASDYRGWLDEAKSAQELSIDNGLLSIGNIDMAGATITRRLDDSVSLGSWVKLKSMLMPKANGNYFVVSKTHKGHLRGEEWFTELKMIRQGAAV